MAGDVFKRQLARRGHELRQRVVRLDDRHVLPVINGNCQQPRPIGERFGGHAEVGLSMHQHRGDLRWIGLQQLEPDLRKLLRELLDHLRQDIARLRVRSRDAQCALRAARIVARQLLQVVDLQHDAFGGVEHDLAGRSQALHALAVPREDRHTELTFEIDDRLRDAGLRRVQRAGRVGQAELVARRLAQESKLLQVHAQPRNMGTRFYIGRSYVSARRRMSIECAVHGHVGFPLLLHRDAVGDISSHCL